MEDGRRIFTGAFEAGKFGAGGNGHLARFDIAPGREYVFEYRIRFDAGFDFSRGKIPGLAGGNAPRGCDASTAVGFTARQMWRQQGRLISIPSSCTSSCTLFASLVTCDGNANVPRSSL